MMPIGGGLWRRGVARGGALWPLLVLVALLAFNLIFTPGFARLEWRDGRLYGSLVDIVQNGTPVLLLAIGMTLVIACAGIDLSVGSVMALAGAAAALLLTRGGQPAGVAVAGGLAAGVAVGLLNGAMVTGIGLQPIVATLITLVAARGAAQWLTADQKIRFEAPAFEFLANGALLGIPTPVWTVVGIAAAVALVLRRTALGMTLEAVGSNLPAARLCGLRIHAVRFAAYAFCGLCAAAAGLIAAADIQEADVANAGLYLELDAILAVVLGGTRLTGGRPRLFGSLLGAAIMQTLTVMLQMRGVVTEHTLIVKALVALFVCWLQSPGFASLARRLSPRPAVRA
jgi:simple sugar transport system permease protein